SHGNRKVELIWTVVPTVILIIIRAISVPVLLYTDTFPPEDTTIYVTGFQFGWIFKYEDGTNQTGEVWFQEDIVVKFVITSTDVIHGFALPQLGVKVDAIPGRDNIAWVRAEDPGEYITQCAEFCGVGHYGMRATIHVFRQGERDNIYGPPVREPTFTPVELRQFGGNATAPWSIRPATVRYPFGSEVRLRIWNNNSVSYDFRVDTPIDVNVTVAPFSSADLVFNITEASAAPVAYGPVDSTARANGMVGQLTIELGTVIVIHLGEWFVTPQPPQDPLRIARGETVIFEVHNVGTQPHNFTMKGVYSDVKHDEIIFPGGTVFVGPYTFGEDAGGRYICAVPGHEANGMRADYIVGEGTVTPTAALPLYDMTLLTFAVGSVAIFVYVIHHARRRDD
ncbi:MAG: hypothetical protein HY557_00140, partial [Euryarchaeota archaeon]|nr:hypothetical protein [Euryarchaeota archaeon]